MRETANFWSGARPMSGMGQLAEPAY